MHQSIATIDSPEFINLQALEINPLMSSCEIKVLYIGENRNHSFITKEVATEMSKTLRGAPIVGYYRENKEDFADHGEKVTFDDQGIHFDCMTKPYGFVSPDAKVWFQKFEDYDDFGNPVVREYLMTTGYLWTGQFEECQVAVNEGRPHSMELDEKTLDGHWSTNVKSGMDFFIINDAIFSKLCILGNDVEPCFEGSSITAPKVSKTFALDNEFKTTLFSMMQDLKNFALKGGKDMENLENAVIEEIETPVTDFTNEVSTETQPDVDFKKNDKEDQKETTPADKEDTSSKEAPTTEKDDSSKEAPADEKSDSKNTPPAGDETDEEKKKKVTKSACNDDDEKKKYSLESDYQELNSKFAALQTQYENLEARYNELVEFKRTIEDAKKEDLINSFYMLSEEDKADVRAHKTEYSYDDIEAKLSVICVRKKVNFDLEDNSKNNNTIEENPIVTFNLENNECAVPAWISALKNARTQNN